MTRPSAFFLVPEWGQQRTASLFAYLSEQYALDVAEFNLPEHSRGVVARTARNLSRLMRQCPPLFDRYSGFEEQIRSQIRGHYDVAVVEHFWCASYAPLLRPHAELLVLDLHNIESQLARTHARATRGLEAIAFDRFAQAYERLERKWLGQYDVLLVASEEDRQRVNHRRAVVYPNALPEISQPECEEADRIVFSGNMEYHPNVEAVRWFHKNVWPHVREKFPELEWWLVGRNPRSVEKIVAGDLRVRLTGLVNDALPLIAEAKVAIVPLLSGSGTRFKILEAWAAGRAVVSTAIGAEGLGARHGEQLLLADDAAGFTDAIVSVLNNGELKRRLGENGRSFYVRHFTWPAAWEKLKAAGI
jgi:glycosyltransferase involved in cell wall biosynthesis